MILANTLLPPPASRSWLEASRAELGRELSGRRWLSEPSAGADDFEIQDFTCLPGEPDPFVLTVLRFHGSGKRYFVPLRTTPTAGRGPALHEASYDPGLLSALVRCMREQLMLVTERRLTIQCRSHAPLSGVVPPADAQATWALPFQEGMSSNCLSELRHGAGRSVYKLYKRLSPDTGNELRALELLAGTGLAPELLGSVTYQEGHSVQALGALTSRVEGEPIHQLLSRHIKALCAQVVRAPAEGVELTRRALVELEPVCRGLGENLLRFHRGLNRGLTLAPSQRPRLQLSRYLDAHRERWEHVRAAVEQDAAVPQALRTRVLQRLDRLAREVLAPERVLHLPPLPATVAHGDLHLSHVLVAPEASGPPRFYILDVSPRSLDEQAPAFLTQTVLQDVLSLWRAIQYFSFDELLDGVKDVLGISQLEATRLVLEQPQRLPPACVALLQLLADWSQGVFRAVERAYRGALHREELLDLPPACSRLFYAGRLLQELEYNYSYGREFFKYCDFYYLLQMEGLD